MKTLFSSLALLILEGCADLSYHLYKETMK